MDLSKDPPQVQADPAKDETAGSSGSQIDLCFLNNEEGVCPEIELNY